MTIFFSKFCYATLKVCACYFPLFTSRLISIYLRHYPSSAHKLQVWEKIVGPYLVSRQMPVTARLNNGTRLHGTFPDVIHVYSYFFGVWEPAITVYYKSILRPGDIVIDIGANVGAHALLAAELVGPTGWVHAVEASPSIFRRLKDNLATNRAENVVAYNFAVLDRTESVPVFLHDEMNLGGTTVITSEALNRDCAQESIVEGRPLSAIIPINEISTARLIKIDVEGAEWLVIKGMHDVLPRLHRNVEILIEVTPSTLREFGITVDGFLAVFSEYGFTPFQVPNRYSPDFYICNTEKELVPFKEHEFDYADIVFRRASRF